MRAQKSKKLVKLLAFYLTVSSILFIGLLLCSNQVQAQTQNTRTGQVAPKTTLTLQVPLLSYAEATNIAEYVYKIYQASLYIIVPIIILVIIMGGIMWIISGGDSAVISKAKSTIINASISLGIALFSYVLFSLVGIKTLKTPDVEYLEPDLSSILPDQQYPTYPTPGPNQSPDPNNPNNPKPTTNQTYAQICAKYNGRYNAQVAQECRALGDAPPPGLDLVPMGSYGRGAQMAERSAFESFKRAADCCKANFNYTITATCFRGAARQYQAYQDYLNGGNPAAKPCCSNHGHGTAFDIRINNSSVSSAQVKQITSCFNSNGLYNWPVENWHWSTTGT